MGTAGAEATAYTETVPRGAYEYGVRAVSSTTSQASGYSNSVTVRAR